MCIIFFRCSQYILLDQNDSCPLLFVLIWRKYHEFNSMNLKGRGKLFRLRVTISLYSLILATAHQHRLPRPPSTVTMDRSSSNKPRTTPITVSSLSSSRFSFLLAFFFAVVPLMTVHL